MRTARSFVVCIIMALAGVLAAQDKAPELTPDQKKDLTITLQQVQIAQLRADQAQREYREVTAAAQKQLDALQKPGFQLDITKLEYVAQPKPAEPATPAPTTNAPAKKGGER